MNHPLAEHQGVIRFRYGFLLRREHEEYKSKWIENEVFIGLRRLHRRRSRLRRR